MDLGINTYDAIIVLGGGVTENETLTEIPQKRMDTVIGMFKNKVAPYLVCSGHFSFLRENEHNVSESAAMKKYAVNCGISSDSIITEDESKDTLGNAYFCRINVVDPKGWKKIAVVTSDFHLARAKYLFLKVFGKEYSLDFLPVQSNLSPDDQKSREISEERQLVISKQWLDPVVDGDCVSIKKLMFTKHPGYAKNPEISVEQLKQMVSYP